LSWLGGRRDWTTALAPALLVVVLLVLPTVTRLTFGPLSVEPVSSAPEVGSPPPKIEAAALEVTREAVLVVRGNMPMPESLPFRPTAGS
jgi:hypothetical protein